MAELEVPKSMPSTWVLAAGVGWGAETVMAAHGSGGLASHAARQGLRGSGRQGALNQATVARPSSVMANDPTTCAEMARPAHNSRPC